MKKNLHKLVIAFSFIFSLTSLFGQNNPFIGSWLGQIDTLGIKLRIAFHISEQTGVVITKMDSPDQNSFANPANKTTITDNNIIIDFPLMGAKYDGKLQNDELTGLFHQSGIQFKLVLKRFNGELSAPKRPQTPVAPFPYSEKEVIIKTADEKVKLSGTLTIPAGKGPFPAVVLISGSGPQNRNEELMGHQPFFVLADHLSRNGIAVLRYDDRGVGKSTGNFAKATTFDFAEDAESAWAFLSKQKKIDKTKVGLLGHSEGGLVAPIAASKNKDIDFIILMAGPSVPGSIIIPDQQELIMKAAGTSEKEITREIQLNRLVINYVSEHATSSSLQTDLIAKIEEWVDELGYPVPKSLSKKSFAKQTAQSYTGDWMKTFITLPPAEYLREVSCPVLALFGENDLQVSVRANLEPMQQLLQFNSNSTIKTFPGLNHLFQTSKTGSPSEYQLIEETISPAFMEYTHQWIKNIK